MRGPRNEWNMNQVAPARASVRSHAIRPETPPVSNPVLAPVIRWLDRLSYPKLFLVAAGLFVANMFVPDPLPFVDELLFGIAAMVISRRKRAPARERSGEVIDGEARRQR